MDARPPPAIYGSGNNYHRQKNRESAADRLPEDKGNMYLRYRYCIKHSPTTQDIGDKNMTIGQFGGFRNIGRDDPEADANDYATDIDDLPFGEKWDDDTPDCFLFGHNGWGDDR